MKANKDSDSEGTVIEGEGEGRIIENESVDSDDDSLLEARQV